MSIEIQKLKYGLDQLAPTMSRDQVDFHYNVHTKKYFDTTNELIVGTKFEGTTDLDQLVDRDALQNTSSKLYNNACQAWNHQFWWQCLAPKGKTGAPSADLLAEIIQQFGSLSKFQKQFAEKAMDQFGSGWAWLVRSPAGLNIRVMPNARNPVSELKTTPLLTIDVWEHAYYVDYPADRKKFLEEIWNIIDWNFVNEQFKKVTR